jgi:alpha-tubulin suppressor-like RCC1 family protein
MLSRTAPRAVPRCTRASSTRANILAKNGASSRTATAPYQSRGAQKQQQLSRSILAIAAAGGLATVSQFYINDGQLVRTVNAEAPQDEEQAALVFEQSRKKLGVSEEENRDLISSQHLQVKRSWESPGVYAWGSNSGRVVAPDSTENNIKTPRRIAFFDGKLLRDIQLDRNFGAAIDEQGNLLQWGTGYAPDTKAPVQTLAGKNLTSLTLSKDRIIALSKSGSVYSVPVSAEEQTSGAKPSESSWIPFVSSSSRIAYRNITPPNLARSERVTSIAGGLEHSLLLTSTGRVFSAASATDAYPSRGQLGVPGLSWLTRPTGDFDQPHEITTLKGFTINAIAAGDRHSLALDSEGRLFAWGDNASGQLGFDSTAETAAVDAPSLVPIHKPYAGTSQSPRITSISAGGSNTYFTVDATRVASPGERDPAQLRTIGRVTSDTFALGTGITGSLGNSRWTHVQSTPAKIPSLSSLFEYDEATSSTVPIRLASLSVGATHAAAVMRNITQTDISTTPGATPDSTNWGADIVFWGGNEHYQLGTGKRNNAATPLYIQPLDSAAELARAKKSTGSKEEHRFHITPRATARLGDGRKVSVEQKVVCGRATTCVYSSV